MSTSYEMDKLVCRELGDLAYPINEAMGNSVIDAIIKDFNFNGGIKLEISNRHSNNLYGTAWRNHGGNGARILLNQIGMTIDCLLHEIAHVLPNGRHHGLGWVVNYTKLMEWWKRNHHRFERPNIKRVGKVNLDADVLAILEA